MSGLRKSAESGVNPRRQTVRASLSAFLALGIGFAPAPSVLAASKPDSGSSSTSKIVFEDLSVDVLAGAKLSYRIVAATGEMDEESRIVEMKKPDVKIYDSQEAEQQRVSSLAGKLWPVTLEETLPDGSKIEVSKYDWQLDGDVQFQSAEGHEIRSPELIFNSKERNISSRRGVQYRIPTGRGSILSGEATEFVADIDPESGAVKGWALTGGVKLAARSEKSPDGAAEGEPSEPKDQ